MHRGQSRVSAPRSGQARRLGHKIPDKIEHLYSHVAPEVETRLITALQRRWTNALNTLTTTNTLALPAAMLPTPPAA